MCPLPLFLENKDTVKATNLKLLIDLILSQIGILHLIDNFVLKQPPVILTSFWMRRRAQVFLLVCCGLKRLWFFAAHVIVVLFEILFHD